jgi:hypothetical protein
MACALNELQPPIPANWNKRNKMFSRIAEVYPPLVCSRSLKGIDNPAITLITTIGDRNEMELRLTGAKRSAMSALDKSETAKVFSFI